MIVLGPTLRNRAGLVCWCCRAGGEEALLLPSSLEVVAIRSATISLSQNRTRGVFWIEKGKVRKEHGMDFTEGGDDPDAVFRPHLVGAAGQVGELNSPNPTGKLKPQHRHRRRPEAELG